MSPTPLVPHPAAGPDYPRWSETLRDHSHVLIRPITPQDREADRAFLEGLSPESRRYRFLGQVVHPSEALLEDLTDMDYVHEVAFAAVVAENSHERFVGVGRYQADQDDTRCECAVTVSDDWQNRGLGTVLMKHLIEVAREHGMRRMYSIDSIDNTRMRDLAQYLGFETRTDPDDASQVIHELEL